MGTPNIRALIRALIRAQARVVRGGRGQSAAGAHGRALSGEVHHFVISDHEIHTRPPFKGTVYSLDTQLTAPEDIYVSTLDV